MPDRNTANLRKWMRISLMSCLFSLVSLCAVTVYVAESMGNASLSRVAAKSIDNQNRLYDKIHEHLEEISRKLDRIEMATVPRSDIISPIMEANR